MTRLQGILTSVLLFPLASGAVPDAAAYAHRGQPHAMKKGDLPTQWHPWIWLSAVLCSASVLGGLLVWACVRCARHSYSRVSSSDESPQQLGSWSALLHNKRFLVTKGIAGTAFRTIDLTLDLITGIKFYKTGDKWWSALTFTFIMLSPLPQYVFVKMQRGWGAKAVAYLVPGSLAHLHKEILHLQFIQKLPQSALDLNMHKMVGGAAMNEVLAGLECAFESLPQGCLQLRAFCVRGGNWINMLSIASSFIGVAMGVFFAYKAVTHKQHLRGFWFGEKVAIPYADGQAIQLQDLELDSQTEDALLWLAAHDEDYKIWNLSRTNVHDKFLKKLAQACPWITEMHLQKCKAVTDIGVQDLVESCRGLTSMDLASTSITDAAVQDLAKKCPGLTSANLAYCREITGTALKELSQNCRGLEKIILRSCVQITDAPVQELAQNCPGLKLVELDLTQVGDLGVQALAQKCPGLRLVSFSRNHITDAGVQELAQKCPELSIVSLHGCKDITDVAVQELAQKCPELTEINLSNTLISDAAVKMLVQKCPRLTAVSLSSCCAITDAMVYELKQEHPGVQLKL